MGVFGSKNGRKEINKKAISDGNGTSNFDSGTLSWLELPRWFLLPLFLIAGRLLQKEEERSLNIIDIG